MKRKIKILGIILFGLIFIYLYSRSSLGFPFYPYIDTIFAKNFTFEKFDSVKMGMSKEEVLEIMEEPMLKSNPGNECWWYSGDGKLWPYVDFSWYQYLICFKEDKVIAKPINNFND